MTDSASKDLDNRQLLQEQNIETRLKTLPSLNADDFRNLLTELSQELSPLSKPRMFEIVAQQIATCGNEVIQPTILNCLESAIGSDLKYLCVAVRASYFRRLRQYQQSRDCLRKFTTPDERQSIPVLNHLLAISYLSGTSEDARLGLSLSRTVLTHQSMKDNPGALHAAAHLSLNLAFSEDINNDEKHSLLNDAENWCRAAILLEENRGRYHYTLARIFRAQGHYGRARGSIQHAIEIEDRSAADAMLRITDYMIEESRIELDELLRHSQAELLSMQGQHQKMHKDLDSVSEKIDSQLKEQSEANEKRMRDAERLTIGVLGFFAGILSLLQISSQKISRVESAGDVLAQIGTFALIIGVFVFAGVYFINRGRSPK